MGSKTCIYENASILGKVDGAALIENFDQLLDQGLSEKQAFIQAMSIMAQTTQHNLETLRKELNLDYEVKIIVPKTSFLKEAQEYIDSNISEGSLAKDLVANGIGVKRPGFIKTTLKDYLVPSSKEGTVLSGVFNFFSRFVGGYRPTALPKLTPLQEDGLKSMGKFSEVMGETLLKMNSFIKNTSLYKSNLEGTYDPKDPSKGAYGDLSGYFVQETTEGVKYLNENFMAAMSVASLNWLGTEGEQSIFNDDAAIRSILSLSETEYVPDGAKALLADVGTARTALNERIGAEIFSLLGMKAAKGISDTSVKKMQMSLGISAVSAMIHMGILVENEVASADLREYSTQDTTQIQTMTKKPTLFIRMRTDQNNAPVTIAQRALDIVSSSDGVINHVFKLGTALNNVSFTKIEEVPTKVNRKRRSIPAKQQEAVKQLQDVAYVNYDNNYELFSFIGEDTWKEIEGFENDIDSLHVTQRIGARGKNRAIERDIRLAQEHKTATPRPESKFYFPWFVISNFRMMIKSNGLNVQSSKIHRWLVGPKAWNVTIKPGGTKQLQILRVAIAQSFGYDIDKQDLVATDADFNSMLADNDIMEAVATIKYVQSDAKQSEEEAAIGRSVITNAIQKGKGKAHSMAGLIALAAYTDAVTDGVITKEFNTNLGLETDGITNGVIITLLQSMLDKDIDALLASGGVFSDGKTLHFGDWYNGITNIDSYERLALSWNKQIADLKFPDEVQTFLQDLFEDLVDKEGNVTKFGRKLSKTPLMTSNYSAGINSISKALADEAMENWYSKLMAAETQAEINELVLKMAASNDADIQVQIEEVKRNPKKRPAEKIKKHVGYLQSLLSNRKGNISYPKIKDRKDWVLPKTARDNALTALRRSMGKALGGAISSQLPEVSKYGDAVNNGFKVMFFAHQAAYNSAIEKAEKKKYIIAQGEMAVDIGFANNGRVKLSPAEESEIYKSLRHLLPAIDSPMSTKLADRLVIMGTTKVRDYDAYTDTTQVTFATPINNRASDKKKTRSTSTVSLDVFKEPGVAPSAVTTQMIDAVTMVGTIPTGNLMNVHDAIIKSITEAVPGAEVYNNQFINVNKDYSILAEIQKATLRVLKDLKDSDPKLYEQAVDAFNMDAIDRGTSTLDVTLALQNDLVTDITRERKDFFENRLTATNQMSMIGSSDIPVEVEQELSAEQEIEALLDKEFDKLINDAGDSMKRPLGSQSSAFDYNTFQSEYEAQLTADNTLSNFEYLSDHYQGDVKDSAEHTTQLREVLGGIVNKVISEADAAPVSLRVNKKGKEVLGQITDGIVQIQAGHSNVVENTSQLSTQEVFVHEMVHHITDFALQTDFVYRTQIERLRSQVKKVITIEDFMPEHTALSKVDDYIAAKKRYDYIFSGKDSLQEFVAFGMTNAQIRKKLAAIPATPTRDLTSGSVWDRLKELFNAIMDFVQGKIYNTHDVRADEALDILVNKLVETNSRYHESIRERLGFIGSLDKRTIALLNKRIYAPLHRYQKRLDQKTDRNILEKSIKSIVDLPFVLRNSTGRKTFLHAIKQVLAALRVTEQNFLLKLAKEIQGITADNSQWHTLLRMSKMYVDQERRHIAELISKAVKDSFIGDLTDAEADSITQALLKTDVAVLQGKYTLGEITKLLRSASYRTAEMNKIQTQLRKFNAVKGDGNGNYYIRQALNLGGIMATGSSIEDKPMLNAYNIAQMRDLDVAATGDLNQAEALIDQLASLSAIQHTDKEINLRAATVIDREYKGDPTANGILYTLETHENFKKESLEQLFQGNKSQAIKGYTTEITNPNIEIRIGEDNEKTIKEMNKLGFKREEGLTKDKTDSNKTSMALYVNRYASKNIYMKSITSLTNMVGKGTDIMEALRLKGTKPSNVNRIIQMTQIAKNQTSGIADQFKNSTPRKKDPKNNVLVPIVDDAGNITSYRYMMTEATKNGLLDKSNKFDIILGRMQASIHDKVKSADINKQVLNTALDDYTKNYTKDPGAYVTIGPKVANERYREIFAMMPGAMKQDMLEIWGNDEIIVREELIDLIFGYRKLSFTDIKVPFARDEYGNTIKVFDQLDKVLPGASNIGKATERAVMEFVGVAKDNIVIKSGVVLWDNIFSNNVILMVRGVNPKYIAKDSALAYTALNKYQEEVRKRAVLQHKLDISQGLSAIARKNLTKQIESYTDSIQANPVRELVEEGVFQSIVEDIEVHAEDFSYRSQAAGFVQGVTGRFAERGEAAEKSSSLATEVYKQAYMTKDTQVYQKLLEFTQKSDFVARFVLYQHHMRKLDKQVLKKKLTGDAKKDFVIQQKQKALLDVIETFINYDIPTSPELQYLNDIGVLMFTKFLFRIQKIIFRMLKENPANTMALFALEHAVGDLASIDDSSLLWTSIMGKLQVPGLGVADSALQVSAIELGSVVL